MIDLSLPAKLDGVSVQAIKRMADAHHSSINEWLEIDSNNEKDTGKKRVIWNQSNIIHLVTYHAMHKICYSIWFCVYFILIGTLGRYWGTTETGEAKGYWFCGRSDQLEASDGSKRRNSTSTWKNQNHSKQIWQSVINVDCEAKISIYGQTLRSRGHFKYMFCTLIFCIM